MSESQAELALDQIVSPGAASAIGDPIEAFLEALRPIASEDAARRDAFVSRTRERVHQCAPQLSKYLEGIESTLFDSEWVSDEWLSVCRRRTRIADLLTLYGGTFNDTQLLLWLDTEQVDESITERSEFEGPVEASDIPPEIPASHWWWWHPGEPPADRA